MMMGLPVPTFVFPRADAQGRGTSDRQVIYPSPGLTTRGRAGEGGQNNVHFYLESYL